MVHPPPTPCAPGGPSANIEASSKKIVSEETSKKINKIFVRNRNLRFRKIIFLGETFTAHRIWLEKLTFYNMYHE